MKFDQSPPVATVPLGTGNNLPFAFGWKFCVNEKPKILCDDLQGKKNPGTDFESVKLFLRDAKEMKVDSWHVLMRMESSCDPIGPLEAPHSLHAEGHHTFCGELWNDFSMGMVAQASFRFHTERKLDLEKFKNQTSNQSQDAKLRCSQGWSWASFFSHPSSWNIAQLAKVKIMKKTDHWEDPTVPPTITSIICLNLPSFSGGLDPWGIPNITNLKEWTPAYIDDGFLEVVGFQNTWDGTVLDAPSAHGTRLAQASRVRFEFHKGVADHTFMSMDGQPWKQPLPRKDDTVFIEISSFESSNHVSCQKPPIQKCN